jgi:Gly-Xaa carboxypeptidase
MAIAKLALLLVGVAGVVAAPNYGQEPLGAVTPSRFQCDLPQILDPKGDGLPSANELFASKSARDQQVKRLQAIVQVPSISYDDLGPVGEDERWAPFYDLHEVLEKTFPTV